MARQGKTKELPGRPPGQPSAPDWVGQTQVPQPHRTPERPPFDPEAKKAEEETPTEKVEDSSDSKAPGGKAWAASAGGQLSINIGVILAYFFGLPWDIAVAIAAVLLAVIPAAFVYITPHRG